MQFASIAGGKRPVRKDDGESRPKVLLAPRPDIYVEGEVKDWSRRNIDRLVLASQYNSRRHMIAMAAPGVFEAFLRFASAVEQGARVGCLFVFNTPAYYAESETDGSSVVDFLIRQMKSLSPDHSGMPGDPVHIGRIVVRCPVTGVRTGFDDFVCVVFCPQFGAIEDPLHDPERVAPYPCVNIRSDMLAASHAVRDTAQMLFREEVYRLKDRRQIDEVLASAFDDPLALPPGLTARWRNHFNSVS
jgi:hypothetical protein